MDFGHRAESRATPVEHGDPRKSTAARILIAATTYWPTSARIAIAFAELGCTVAAIYPRGGPLSKTFILAQSYTYRTIHPLWSLQTAIRAFRPDLIVPCDDRVVRHLHSLYAVARRQGDTFITASIEQSLGNPRSYPVADKRIELMNIAFSEGLLIPDSRVISNIDELEEWSRDHELPWVLKCDESTAGDGVSVVRSHVDAALKYRKLSSPMSARGLARAIVRSSEWFWVRQYMSRRCPAVTVQKFIRGQPANIAVACWKGEVLAATSALALSVIGDYGATTVARVIDNEPMRAAARQIVRRLQISGFVGFDFIIEEVTGDSYLIEMNPRLTQLSTIRLGLGSDLVGTLFGALSGKLDDDPAPVTTQETVAFFPQAWLCNPNNPLIPVAYHDVPWNYPELVRELMRIPRPQRSLAARLARRLAK